jgi:hypothetical protein
MSYVQLYDVISRIDVNCPKVRFPVTRPINIFHRIIAEFTSEICFCLSLVKTNFIFYVRDYNIKKRMKRSQNAFLHEVM